jgi:predicted PurR-regulated permease PerM
MNTEWSKPTKYIAGVSMALLGIYVLYLSRPVIPLLIIAALIAVIVRPVILWLHRRANFPRALAVMFVYLLVVVLVPLALLLAIPTIVDALGYVISLDYQSFLQGGIEWLSSALTSIKTAQFPVPTFDAYIERTVDTLLAQLQQVTPSGAPELPPLATILRSLSSVLTATFDVAADLVGAVFSQVALLIFMFLASIYISLGAHTYRSAILRTVPDAYQEEITVLLARIEQLWNAFFRGQLTLMLLIGAISSLGLTVLGVPGALYLGIIAGLLEIVPNLGPIIATIPAVIVALLQGSTYLPVNPLLLTLLVILFYVLVQQLENSVIVPRVLGDAVELPALVVITGVIIGTSVGGILGALLATPVIASGREILRYVYQKIQGEDPFPLHEAKTESERHPTLELLQRFRKWISGLSLFRQVVSDPAHSDERDPEVDDPADHPEQTT